MNNAGLIARITDIRPHRNADTLSIGLVNYNEVIIKNGSFQENDLIFYIPVDCQIGVDFAVNNKLTKHTGGYLEDEKRNVRALRLRGERSNGLVLSLKTLEGYVSDISKLKDGDDISELKGEIIVQKYIAKTKPQALNNRVTTNTPKLKPEEKTLFPLFKEHISTSHLTRNLHKFKKGDKVTVTLKQHGCFTSDTKVRKWGEDRAVKITQVKIGDVLIGYDEDSKKYVPSKVLNVFKNGKTADWMELHITRNGYVGEKIQKIKCTPNHKFFIDNTYIEASKLKVGQKVKTIKDTILLTRNQKSTLLGLALGDGSITCRNTATKIEFSHKSEHLELLDYEINSLGNVVNPAKRNKISGFGTKITCSQTKELVSIKSFIDSIFIDRHSFVKEQLMDNLDDIVLAFLYLSDGSLSHNDSQEDRANIAICSFDDVNAKILVDCINEKFDLKAILYKDSKGYNRCRFNKDCAKKLFDIIEKYIPLCCRYKLPSDYIFSVEKPVNLYSEGEFGYLDIENEIVFIGNPNLKRAEKYDLETETHNYVVGNSHVHNSSGRTSNTLVLKRKKQNWFQKLISKITKKKPEYEKEYKLVTGTRRVIIKDFSQKGYYDDNIFRKKWHDFFEGKLEKGITVYYEIVGYCGKGKLIMGKHSAEKIQDKEVKKKYGKEVKYTYGCEDGESDIYVYRITSTSESGAITEYTTEQTIKKCKELGVKYVPVLAEFIYTDKTDIERIIEIGNADCELFPEHPREGVVVRNDSTENAFDVYKYKSFLFCELEGINKDAGVIDIEEAASLEVDE